MQVIEKVKVVPEGYNGAGMDGYNRRDVNGKANAGLTLGIIGTALGAWALFGNNRRSTGLLGTTGGGGMLGDGSTNINVVGAGIGAGTAAPSAFQAWAKSCEDTLALQGGLYQWALTQQNQRFQDRQVIDSEMFGLYKSQIDADFSLYKGQRDNYDGDDDRHRSRKHRRDHDEHFDEREAYDTVEEMYHVKGDKKYVGEKFDMDKAHKVYEKLRDADGYTIGDIYVAINAQYHDYCELFEKWFGSNFDEKIIASAVDFWFEDDDFDGNKVWKYFNEM